MGLLETGYLSNSDFHAVCGEGCIYPRCDHKTCEGRRKTGEWVKSTYRAWDEAVQRVMAEEYGSPNGTVSR